jgi:hypothetical protein
MNQVQLSDEQIANLTLLLTIRDSKVSRGRHEGTQHSGESAKHSLHCACGDLSDFL